MADGALEAADQQFARGGGGCGRKRINREANRAEQSSRESGFQDKKILHPRQG